MRNYDLVGLDFDGVVADTTLLGYLFLQDVCERVGAEFPFQDLQDYRLRVPSPFTKAYDMCGIDLSIHQEEISEMFKAFHKNVCPRTYEGLSIVLNALAKKGVKLAIASDNEETIISNFLAVRGIKRFQFIAGVERVDGTFVTKPESRCLERCMEHFGVAAERTLYVGDMGIDGYLARRLRVDFAGVHYGVWHESRMKSYGPDFPIHRPEDIAKVVLNGR